MNERAACVHSWMKNPELLAREFRQFLGHLESYTQSDDHWAHPGSEARRLFLIPKKQAEIELARTRELNERLELLKRMKPDIPIPAGLLTELIERLDWFVKTPRRPEAFPAGFKFPKDPLNGRLASIIEIRKSADALDLVAISSGGQEPRAEKQQKMFVPTNEDVKAYQRLFDHLSELEPEFRIRGNEQLQTTVGGRDQESFVEPESKSQTVGGLKPEIDSDGLAGTPKRLSSFREPQEWLRLRRLKGLSSSRNVWPALRKRHAPEIDCESTKSARISFELAQEWGLDLPEFREPKPVNSQKK